VNIEDFFVRIDDEGFYIDHNGQKWVWIECSYGGINTNEEITMVGNNRVWEQMDTRICEAK
jgi:hypothetical protein